MKYHPNRPAICHKQKMIWNSLPNHFFQTKVLLLDFSFKKSPIFWQGRQDLNSRHAVLETAALPTELRPYNILYILS